MARQQNTRDNPGRCFNKSLGYWQVYWQENGKNKQMLEHRWIYEQVNGPIPKGYEIHHIDHNKLNNDISNLQCLTKGQHSQIHGKQTYDSAEAARAAKEEYDREYHRQYREANREAYNEYQRERQRQWREANREAYNESRREYQRLRYAKRKLELAASAGS